MLQLAVREAFKSPFLMDELLALAAAHKSTLLDDERRDWHRTEATRLQTRALTQFNVAHPDVSDDNCLAVFLFSALLGQHVLFDTFSSLQDLPGVLDKLVQCLGLHRGIAIIAGQSWPMLQDHIMPPHLAAMPEIHRRTVPETSSPPGDECADLTRLLDRSELSASSDRACRTAVEVLQPMFDAQRVTCTQSCADRRLIVVQEWPVRIPSDYISLLSQRRPEAMVILAYYAVLLHHARDYWVVGDAGKFLIRSISEHLGAYWAEWLVWPNHMLETSTPVGSAIG
jgi:hypothetical protein